MICKCYKENSAIKMNSLLNSHFLKISRNQFIIIQDTTPPLGDVAEEMVRLLVALRNDEINLDYIDNSPSGFSRET